jgi:outer membrane protein insertion porin family
MEEKTSNKLIIKLIIILNFLSCDITFCQSTNKIFLEEIIFSGNEAFSKETLIGLINLKENPSFFWRALNKISSNFGKEEEYFDQSYLQIDADIINNYYFEHGYFEAQVKSYYKIDSTEKKAYVYFDIIEGAPYKYENYEIYGLDNIPSALKEKIDNLFKKGLNQRFKLDNYRYSRSEALKILYDNGYLFAKINQASNNDEFADIVVNKIKKTVIAKAYFTTNDKFKVSEIRVDKKGKLAYLIDDKLITKIVGIKPGDIYSFEKLNQSQIRLYRTGLFISAFVNAVSNEAKDSLTPIQISVVVGSLREISPEVILNNQEGFFNAGLGITHQTKNFLGEARLLSISSSLIFQDIYNLNYNRFFKSFSLRDTSLLGYIDLKASVEQPYVFDKPIYGKIQFFGIIDKKKEYNSTIYGGKLSFEFEMPRYTFINSLSLSYSLNRTNFFYNKSYLKKFLSSYLPPEQIDKIEDIQIKDVSTYFGIDAVSLKANNPIFPTKGYNLYFSFEDGNFINFFLKKFDIVSKKSPQFYKALITLSSYFDVYNSNLSTLAIKFKIGHIQNYAGLKSRIPFNKRFYAGGSSSIRAWKTRQLIPQNTLTEQELEDIINRNLTENIGNISLSGGLFLLEHSIETRNHIIGDFGSAIFIDIGNVWNSYNQFSINELAASLGSGLRYYSPIGPIRIDFAYKLYDPWFRVSPFKKNLIKNTEFHFGIGEAF